MSKQVRELLRAAVDRLANTSDDPLLDAQVLLAYALRCDRSWLYAHADDPAPDSEQAEFERLITQRMAGQPVAHLTGMREFWSLDLQVSPATLIPRPETELLVETVLDLDLPTDAKALDLGTGTGAIALALARERPGWRITATDRSAAALAVATDNVERLKITNVSLLQGNWFAALAQDAAFDLIVSNPPYIADHDPHLTQGDVRFEPRDALVSGADGLDDIRHLIASAARYLSPGGWLWFEHGYDQGEQVTELLRNQGFEAVEMRRDLAGNARISGGRHNP